VAGAILFDLSLAFDVVDADISLYGLEMTSCLWVGDYMARRKQQVQVGEDLSAPKEIKHGLPQGGRLSPLLFAVYTSDMTEACPTASLTLYADDTTGAVAANTSEDVCLQMEKVAEEVLSYMADNKLAPNKKKTPFIVFTERMRPSRGLQHPGRQLCDISRSCHKQEAGLDGSCGPTGEGSL
jgi:hypothetical protein